MISTRRLTLAALGSVSAFLIGCASAPETKPDGLALRSAPAGGGTIVFGAGDSYGAVIHALHLAAREQAEWEQAEWERRHRITQVGPISNAP